MTHSLKDKLKNIGNEIVGFIPKGIGILALGYAFVTCADQNGINDSLRTKVARKYHNPENPIKVVRNVGETWSDNKLYVPDGTGFNPLVKRRVIFEDGSETNLRYRTLAWSPFKRWLAGEEFNPQPGEKYEVTTNDNWEYRSNSLVQKVE